MTKILIEYITKLNEIKVVDGWKIESGCLILTESGPEITYIPLTSILKFVPNYCGTKSGKIKI